MEQGSIGERSDCEAQALDVWLDFLQSHPLSDDAAFELLCRQRPDLAPQLQKLRSPAPSDLGTPIDPCDEQEQQRWFEARMRRLAEPIVRGSRYRRDAVIARGGMGVIHRVLDVELNRVLALKELIVGSLAHDSLGAARFLEEAQVTAQLDHPGIVPIHEVGMDAQGKLYFAMKLVQGRDLRTILELVHEGREGWSRTRALGVLLKVCEAMTYAHSKGVIHRDLKPANVMVGHFGEVYVMDWGLARAMGRRDMHDVRPRPADASHSVRTERREEREETPDSPLVTMDGVVIGTPAYMPPEQARGDLQLLSARSDVYSIGAILYHLLTAQSPYVPPSVRVSKHAILFRVIEGPPKPVRELEPSVPDELVAICERAMARDPEARYPDTQALGDDLRAYLEGRVVLAYETGALAELKKWVGRNRGVAAASAAALVMLLGLVASLLLKAHSDRAARLLAVENTKTALAGEVRARASEAQAQEERRRADERTEEVLRLSGPPHLEYLEEEADELWPAYPKTFEGDWLDRAGALVSELPQYEAKLAEIRTKARDRTTQDRASHPRLPELEVARRHLAFLRRWSAAPDDSGTSDPAPEEVGVNFAAMPKDLHGLLLIVTPMVDPDRTDWGKEATALVMLRRGLSMTTDPPKRARVRDMISWALFANSRFEDAVKEQDLAREEIDERKLSEYEARRERLVRAIERHQSPEGLVEEQREIAELEREVETLEREVSEPWRWEFESKDDSWWNAMLERHVRGLKAFSDPRNGIYSQGMTKRHGWGVLRRLEFARAIEERSVSGAEAAAAWAKACAEIQDIVACPLYRGLVIRPQLGLLPIGRDPATGLWEFAHLQTGEPASRGTDGRLVFKPDTGIVFVLLPGGRFWMGAQREDPHGQNYDPYAESLESPVREVSLSPFFLSKYEMTVSQWMRFTGDLTADDGDLSPLRPVLSVSWQASERILRRLGLVLPSEAQWEYGARGGTSSVWWTGNEPESLLGAVNLSDEHAVRVGQSFDAPDVPGLDDGYSLHAPANEYRPNPFGLHNVHGNVYEWCLDGADGKTPYEADPPADPVVQLEGSSLRVIRGGSYSTGAVKARSAFREFASFQLLASAAGVRPARLLDR